MHIYERLRLDPERPNHKKLAHAAQLLREGAFAVLPTGAVYVCACLPEAREAMEAIRRLRKLDEKHRWSLLCRDIREAARYARIDDDAFRLMRRLTPGPYTFVLPASSELPRRIFGKRKEIGIRISAHAIVQGLLAALDAPLLATTLRFPDEELPANDPETFWPRLKGYSCVLLDAGIGGITPTTVLDLTEGEPRLVRAGIGPWPA